MEYQVLWFILWGVLWAVYFATDGFDFGVGMLFPLLGKTDAERRVMLNTIGPVWDGNEVWLVTAGGATFAAFPTTYAYMFSYLYSALALILFALIFRGVAFEFRGKGTGQTWKTGWDTAIFLGSLIPALLFGVAFGNIFRGLPMDAEGYHGTLFGLLNSYGLLTGVLFCLLFIQHGALWLAMRTGGDFRTRCAAFAGRIWNVLALVFVLFVVNSAAFTRLTDNYLSHPVWLAVPLLACLALVAVRFLLRKGENGPAFAASALTIILLVGTGIIGLFPNLIPSSLHPAYSLTIFNSSSSTYTLKIMTVVALIFVPLVIAYQFWVYRIFRRAVTTADVENNPDAY